MPLNPRVKEWTGLRVWIIGASTGIGRALGRALVAHGAKVCFSARSASKLEQATEGLNTEGLAADRVLSLPVDMTDVAALQSTASQLAQQWGGLDHVFVVAGTYAPMRAPDFDLSEVRATFEVNVMGVYAALQAVLPHLASGGHVGIVSSVAGYRGLPKALAYGASKAAANHLAEVLYLDLKRSNRHVHLICPGFVATPLTAQNDFHMPALISPEQAAEFILRGYAKGEFETHFPKRFTNWLKFARLLPYRLYFPLVRRGTGG